MGQASVTIYLCTTLEKMHGLVWLKIWQFVPSQGKIFIKFIILCRQGSSLVVIKDDAFIFGGTKNNEKMKDMWKFDLKQK